ncbi:hypothetical protein HCN51_56145 [Nonomuraea sp. FMUSA5-5]|uniref:Uncharacterized protein n=1 Tax=Nonomuraea composti TaxID=2720023 RepID=A0ABX1BS83_9ACTN|nr:hypothetical protein [Nonomuraea sp. FMUSA5-5]NJP98656.1 hypothetical protein [Nonomuraea sp. FMUSA5-5]
MIVRPSFDRERSPRDRAGHLAGLVGEDELTLGDDRPGGVVGPVGAGLDLRASSMITGVSGSMAAAAAANSEAAAMMRDRSVRWSAVWSSVMGGSFRF